MSESPSSPANAQPEWRGHLQTAGAVITVVSLAIVVAIVLTTGMAFLLDASGFRLDAPGPRAVMDATQFVGFGVAIVAYLQLRDDWDIIQRRVPTLRDVAWIVGGVATMLALLGVLTWFLNRFGLEAASNQIVGFGAQAPAYFLYLIPVTVLLVGPTEELIFRGIVQGTLRREYGPVVAVAVASAVFAVVHWASLEGGGRLITLGAIFVLGAVLGVLYERTENIVVVAAVHGLFNAVQFAGQYAIQTGLLN